MDVQCWDQLGFILKYIQNYWCLPQIEVQNDDIFHIIDQIKVTVENFWDSLFLFVAQFFFQSMYKFGLSVCYGVWVSVCIQ